jgi:hypothetical protein
MPNYQGQTDNPITDYSETLGKTEDYMYSVQHAKDLHLASLPAQAEPEISLNVNEFGIPEDMPMSTPNITEESLQGEKDKSSILADMYNSAPEWMQRAATPFLVPFTNNPVMRGITIGTGDAINGTLNVLRDINNAMHPDNQFSEEEWLQIPDIIERGDSTTEAIVGGLTQFMSVYGALGKFSNVSKLSSKGAKLWDDMWRAGLADAAFDPEDGNLSTFITMLDEDETVAGLPVGKLNGPFTQWLGTPVGEDAEAWERLEGRARNLLEGAGLGMLANGVVASLKGVKQYMVETNPDKYFAMLKKAGFDVDPRQFLFENTLGAENIVTPQVNELGMYSQLDKAMLNLTQDKNTPDDLYRYLIKNGVSKDELKNSGVMDLINEKKAAGESITKAEVGEVFDEFDSTQSYQAATRTYERPSDIDSMTDEDELLNIYQYERQGGDPLVAQEEAAGFNGKVLDHDEMDENIQGHANDIVYDWKNSSKDTFIESAELTNPDLIDMQNTLSKLYPDKYEELGKTEILVKLKKLGHEKDGYQNDSEFLQDVEEASIEIAKKAYDDSPVFQWDLEEGGFNYQITGNEDFGYTTRVWDDANREAIDLDVVYSANEAMVQVQGHQANFGSGAVRTGDETKWHDYIVHDDAIDTYSETVITADSPTKDIFKGKEGNTHFPDDNQVFHLRTTEPEPDILFIEELQSDWNNAISKKGVKKGQAYNQSTRKALQDAVAERNAFLETTDWEFSGDRLMGDAEELRPKGHTRTRSEAAAEWDDELPEIRQQIMAHNKIVNNLKDKVKAEADAMPQSPLPNDKWINVGLRRAIAMAIENGQTRVEWTTSGQQVSQWGKGKDGNFEKMYINLYDKKMPSIAKRIANKYNAKAGKHYIDISPEMIAHHKSGKGDKVMAAAPAIPAAQVANDKEDS